LETVNNEQSAGNSRLAKHVAEVIGVAWNN